MARNIFSTSTHNYTTAHYEHHNHTKDNTAPTKHHHNEHNDNEHNRHYDAHYVLEPKRPCATTTLRPGAETAMYYDLPRTLGLR